MNQILMTENATNNKKQKKASGEDIDIKSVAKFFAVAIIIFGLVLSGSGSYALVQDIQKKASTTVPEVITERNGNAIKLKIKDTTAIKTIKYSWNDSTETVIQGKSQNQVETTINILAGNNKLNITVTDINNNSTKFVKNYVQEERDTTEPVITISNEDPKIKITVTDDTALDYVVYKYGDNEEQKVMASQDDPTKIEIYISDVSNTVQTLRVEALDKAQNDATKEQQVKGVTKSKIEVTPDPSDPSYLVIKVTDDDGIQMVAYYINGQEYKTDPNTSLNTKEFEYKQKVEKGKTNITVHAYNLSEQQTEFIGEYTY